MQENTGAAAVDVVPLGELGKEGRSFVASGWAKSWRAASESLRNRFIDAVLDDPDTRVLVARDPSTGVLLGFCAWTRGQLQWAYTKFSVRGLGVSRAIRAAAGQR